MSDKPHASFQSFLEDRKQGLILIAIAILTVSAILISSNFGNLEENEADANLDEESLFITYSQSKSHLQNSIQENNLQKGYSLFIDGEFICVGETKQDITDAIEDAKDLTIAYYGANDEANIICDITIMDGLYNKDTFCDKDEVLANLGVDGNTISPEDMKLKICYSLPETEVVSVPFEVLYLDANHLSVGIEKKLQSGAEGLSRIDYEVVYVNGVEEAKNIKSEQILDDGVPEIVERGIGKSGMVSASLKIFSLPYYGRITSGFEWRRFNGYLEFHDALDIVHLQQGYSCMGDNIKAAGDGIVTFAGYSGGHGNYILIRHPNGIETGYAHLSAFNVKVGQEVKTGDIIGKIGSTGRSTGPHLHFEVIVNGEKKDPLQFLKDAEKLKKIN